MTRGPAALAVLITMWGAPANAAWTRVFSTPDVSGSDSPPPHSRAYFQVHPCLRTGREDRIRDCPLSPSALLERVRTKFRLIGIVSGLRLFDVDYLFEPIPL